MKLEAFLVIFLCIIIDSCFAAACPVRAILASNPEVDGGYGCVCRPDFYGDKCQFQAQNRSAFEVDAIWRNDNNARVTWISEYGRQFHLSVRPVNYNASTGTFLLSKWRKAVIRFIAVRMEPTAQSDIGTDRATFSAEISLIKNLSYQIRLMNADGGNLTASVFLDAREEFAADDKSDRNNTMDEENSCSWYSCPARLFTEILNDFGKSCFTHGAIFAAPIIVVGMFLVGILVYVVIRRCKSKKQRRDINVEKRTVDSVENLKIDIIQLHEISNGGLTEVVVCPPAKEMSLPHPVVVEIPEILITAPLSEADSQSESSADESSSDEGEYILDLI